MRRGVVALAAVGTATAVTAAAAYRGIVRPLYEQWGLDPDEIGRLLPGDELIGAPTGGETRGITIEAPAAAIWPWLVQMGYGRAGWYSYDALDMRGRSGERIVPEWQTIRTGMRVPTWPGGGFEVAQVEPDHALVLFIDDTIVARQAEEARRARGFERPPVETMPTGLATSAAIMRTQPQQFRASWSFVLEPIDGRRTRLIERVRVEYSDLAAWHRVSGSLFGMGVFLMMRRQMLGIRRRAEALIKAGPIVPVAEEQPVESDQPELVSA